MLTVGISVEEIGNWSGICRLGSIYQRKIRAGQTFQPNKIRAGELPNRSFLSVKQDKIQQELWPQQDSVFMAKGCARRQE